MSSYAEETSGDQNAQRQQAGDYRPQFDVYSGPLDLLLYLIKRDEVDIFDIPIARITEEYLGIVMTMQFLDVNVAGEFLIMSASLMEMKSRMLLPTDTGEDESEEAEEDPRNDLIRQLLEYKRFKEAAQQLQDSADKHALRLPRNAPAVVNEPEPVNPEKLLEGVGIWDLLAAFSRLMRHTKFDLTRKIVFDDVPLAVYLSEVRGRLVSSGGQMEFSEFFSSGDDRYRIIGAFLALLELTRLGEIRVRQIGTEFGEIAIQFIPTEKRYRELDIIGEKAGQDFEAFELAEGESLSGAAESDAEENDH